MDPKQALPLIERVISWATFKRIGLLATLALAGITALTLHENRATVASALSAPSPEARVQTEAPLSLSDGTKTMLRDSVIRSQLVNSVGAFSVNLRANQRQTVFWFTDDAVLEQKLRAVEAQAPAASPLFTADEVNNAQVVGLINGEFACARLRDMANRLITAHAVLEGRVTHVCRVSIPPYYSQFAGYLLFGLAREPSPHEVDALRLEATRLSTEVYSRDVLGSAR